MVSKPSLHFYNSFSAGMQLTDTEKTTCLLFSSFKNENRMGTVVDCAFGNITWVGTNQFLTIA